MCHDPWYELGVGPDEVVRMSRQVPCRKETLFTTSTVKHRDGSRQEMRDTPPYQAWTYSAITADNHLLRSHNSLPVRHCMTI